MTLQDDGLEWIKSSYSRRPAMHRGPTDGTGGRWGRDTKDRNRPAHYFTVAEWDAFIQGAKPREFN